MPRFSDDDPFWFERNILPLWYHFTLLLALTCPLLYLFPFSHPFKPYRTFLALLTAFANLCSYTEPYYLARPVYVCFYPVRGETFHHPEEKRLQIQYSLFFGAWVLAIAVFLGRVGGFVGRDWRRDGRDVVMRQEKEWLLGKEKGDELVEGGLGQGSEDFERGSRWRKVATWVGKERIKDVLMGSAWCLTVGAWLVMWGHSKKGKFGDWVDD